MGRPAKKRVVARKRAPEPRIVESARVKERLDELESRLRALMQGLERLEQIAVRSGHLAPVEETKKPDTKNVPF